MAYLSPGAVSLTVIPRGRAASALRLLSAILALCCFWSFAGASVAMAAGNRQPAPVHSPRSVKPFPNAKPFPALASPFAEAHGLMRDEAAVSPAASGAAGPAAMPAPPAALQPSSETLWDDTGHLKLPATEAQVQAWKQEIKTTHPGSHRAAELHLWLGEVALARDKQPNVGLWHLREAKRLASAKDPLHYLAAYDNAVGLFYAGAYQDSEDAFSSLLAVRHTADGFNRETAALWLRHVSACAGYHALHSALGIPEPPRLDPLCAAAALAARLQVMGLPSDKATLLRACRVTGEGSNMQDILDAGPKLGVHAQAVTADDQGLMALPKPVVAYVEHDHFIALTHADKHGVSYLCSDCGPWPGGRVDLTWQQWHTMDAGMYVVVTQPGTVWDRTLTALKTPSNPTLQVASSHLMGVLPRRVESLVPGWPLLRGHVVMDQTPTTPVQCGAPPFCLICLIDSLMPLDLLPMSVAHVDGNPQGGDPVNLANGQEEYGPDPDLTVYNPAGPSLTWKRVYQTLRGPGQSYPSGTGGNYDATIQSDDFGTGWTQPYNVGVIVSGSTATALFANGGKIAFTFSGSPTSGHPLLGTSSRSGVPLLLQWDYDGSANGHYEIIFKDRTHWITGSTFAPGSVLPLAQITDRNGNSVYFNYPTVSASKSSDGWPLLGSITTGPNATGTVLLSIQRNTAAGSDGLVDSYITSVTDHPGASTARTVFYQATRLTNPNCPAQWSPYYSELTAVSQIVPGGTAAANAPSRFAYVYKAIPNGESNEEINCLHTVTTPSPTGSGTSTAYIWYMTDNTADASGQTNPNYISGAIAPFVGALVDANGNRRLYSSSDGEGNTSGYGESYSQVTVQNSSGSTLYSYQVRYDSNLNETARTDGNGHAVSGMSYASATAPFGPTTVLDGNAANASLMPIPQPGTQLTLVQTGTHSPSPYNWQVLNSSGATVASSSAANGWSVSAYTQSTTSGPVYFSITSPSSAALGQYEARCGPVGVQQNAVAGKSTSTPAPNAGGNIPGHSVSFTLQNPSTSPVGVTTYTYDQYGNVLTKTSPRGTVTTYSYNYSVFPLGELTQVQEGTNLSTPKAPTTYAYDDTDGYIDANGIFQPCGLLSSITTPLPGTVSSTQTATTSYTYDLTGQGQKPLGQLGLGNTLTVTRPGNNAVSTITTTMNYTADGTYSQSAAIGQPLTVMDNLGKITHLRYDSLGNTVGVKDALGNETDMAFTIGNLPLQTVLPATGQSGSGHGGRLTSYLYAEPSSLATPAWPAASLQYGALAGTTQYDESNVGAIRQVADTYGPEGELLSMKGSTEPASYTYDALYRMSTLTDGGGNTTSYFYNPAGYLAQVVYPGAQSTPPTAPLAAGTKDTTSFTSYDGKGDVLSRTDGNNAATTYTYNDSESRLTGITYPSGTIGSVALAYDAYGRRSSMTDGTGGQTYAYDDDNNLTTKAVTWTGLAAKTLSYGFYPDGSRKSMTADGRAFSYGYDSVGRMNALTNDNSETTSYGYQANGWLQSKTLGNSVATTFTRDAQGRVTALLNSLSGTTLSSFSVPATGGYDGVGNRLSVTASMPSAPASYSGTTHYAYDYGQSSNPQLNRSQLTQEQSTRGGSYTNVFGYDGNTTGGPGNPTSFKGTTSTFNADNQVTNTGYAYDGNGSPTTYKSNTLTFDPEQRMTGYGGTTQTDSYDGDGLRTWKQTTSGKTYFLYDGTQPVVEETSTGAVAASNTFGADGLISRRTSGGSVFYTFDERGNVSQRTSSAGAVLSSDLYDAYGARSSTGGADVFGFEAQAGYYTDTETGLILCTHRYFDPSAGRWLTRDPIGYGGGVNLYGYCQNNPANRIDPSGYDVWGVINDVNVGVLGFAGGAAGVALGGPTPIGIPVYGAIGTGVGILAGEGLTQVEKVLFSCYFGPIPGVNPNAPPASTSVNNPGNNGMGQGYPDPDGPPVQQPPGYQTNGNPGMGSTNNF